MRIDADVAQTSWGKPDREPAPTRKLCTMSILVSLRQTLQGGRQCYLYDAEKVLHKLASRLSALLTPHSTTTLPIYTGSGLTLCRCAHLARGRSLWQVHLSYPDARVAG